MGDNIHVPDDHLNKRFTLPSFDIRRFSLFDGLRRHFSKDFNHNFLFLYYSSLRLVLFFYREFWFRTGSKHKMRLLITPL